MDYSLISNSVTLSQLQENPVKCINISITDDSIVEFNEFFVLQSSFAGNTLLKNFINITNSVLVMIMDNDGKPSRYLFCEFPIVQHVSIGVIIICFV